MCILSSKQKQKVITLPAGSVNNILLAETTFCLFTALLQRVDTDDGRCKHSRSWGSVIYVEAL